MIPCAAVMGEATEAIAARTGPGIGGLLNVTFGNAPELIIAFFALIEGLQEVVKASIVGSIIGNILLVLGAAMLVGGLPREKQTFSRTAAHAQSAMLMLALVALIFPAIFQLIHGGGLPQVGVDEVDFGSDLEKLSFGVAIVLLISYVAGLIFSLKTHRDRVQPLRRRRRGGGAPLAGPAGCGLPGRSPPWWSGVMSEILVGSIDEASDDIGLSQFFVGVFVVAIVGNAAEHWVAVLVAAKDKMDLAVNIAIGSSAQIALFVAPLLVLLSFVVGRSPDGARLQRLRAGRAAVRGADREPASPRTASRTGSRACSCCRCTRCWGWSSTSPERARRAPGRSRGVSNVLQEYVQLEGPAPRVPDLILERLDTSELQHRRASRVRRRHPCANVLIDQQGEHRPDLVVQITIDASSGARGCAEHRQAGRQRHSTGSGLQAPGLPLEVPAALTWKWLVVTLLAVRRNGASWSPKPGAWSPS